MRKVALKFIILILLGAGSCQKDEILDPDIQEKSDTPITRAVPTPDFDWQNADWMPTPTGQSRIPSPWVGAGSITATYGIDITNDRYRIDGWELLYNTFDPNAPGDLVNPYFILYNKYRGICVYTFI